MSNSQTPAAAPILRTLWATVRKDPVAQAAIACFLLAAPIGFVPQLTAAHKERLIYTWLPPLFLGLAVFALARGQYRISRRERGLWSDLTVAFGAWLGVRFLYLFYPDIGRPLAVDLAAEVLYAIFYAAFVLALERQPHRGDIWRPAGLEGQLMRPAVAVLVLGLAAYFVFVPAFFDVASYDSLLPSMALYLTLDVFLVTRALSLVAAAREARWRALYSGLALVAAVAAASDVVEFLDYRDPAWSRPLAAEPCWNVMFVLLVLTARLRHQSFPPSPPGSPGERRQGYVPGPSTRTLLFALAFPLIHQGWRILGPLATEEPRPDTGEAVRELVVIVSALVLGAIALVQHRLFGRRAQVLAEQRAQMETTLRKSDSDLRLAKQRRRTKADLRRAEEEFKNFFRLSPGERLISRLADHRVIEVNENLARLTGEGRRAILGRSIVELSLWPDGVERAKILAALGAGVPVRDLEIELLPGAGDHRGERRVVLLSAEPVVIDGAPCMLSVLCDVSERRRAEEPTRRRAAALEEAACALRAVDQEGEIRLWNRAAEELYGWTVAEALAQSAAELLAPRRRPASAGAVAGVEEVVETNFEGDRMALLRRSIAVGEGTELILTRASDVPDPAPGGGS